jgi:hypothetical protein
MQAKLLAALLLNGARFVLARSCSQRIYLYKVFISLSGDETTHEYAFMISRFSSAILHSPLIERWHS